MAGTRLILKGFTENRAYPARAFLALAAFPFTNGSHQATVAASSRASDLAKEELTVQSALSIRIL